MVQVSPEHGDDMTTTASASVLRQELSKYIATTTHAAGYYDTGEIDTRDSYNPSSARLSADPVLTSLAQLAVHRLNAERAFISLIDEDTQNIIAEATRDISLYSSDSHPEGQGLCIGARPLSYTAGVCASTMPAFRQDASQGFFEDRENVSADRNYYIIRDFRLEDCFKDRPYVTDWPFMRSYAEVPIRTSAGGLLGSLAVVDNRCDNPAMTTGIPVLTELASTIVLYLDKLRMQKDYEQTSKFLRGLDAYVHNGSSARSDSVSSEVGSLTTPKVTSLSLNSSVASTERPNSSSTIPQEVTHSSDSSLPKAQTHIPVDPDESRTRWLDLGVVMARPVYHEPGSETSDTSSKSESMLANAANILRDALALENVVFIKSYGSSTFNQVAGSRSGEAGFKGDHNNHGAIGDRVNVLASSTQNILHQSRTLPISLTVHDALIERYPQGHLFEFMAETTTDSQLPPSYMGNVRNMLSCEELDQAVAKAFPAAISVLFLPLWNPQKRNWFASCFGWTQAREAMLRPRDFTFFSLFGSSIVAEITRLELVSVDRAKSQFISSISHELRSPLHGILGCTDMLRESAINDDQRQWIEIVDTCGQTLLDTVEHM